MRASARGTATRGAGSAGVGSGSSTLGRAEAEHRRRRRRPRPRASAAPIDRVLEAPAPAVACARHDAGATYACSRRPCPTSPPSSPAARGTPTRSRSTGATSTTTPRPRSVEAADAAIAALRDRGSPSHDGVAARLVGHARARRPADAASCSPSRWALRLVEGDASHSVAALCVTRDADGPLARRPPRAVAVVVGRALGAGRRRRGRRRREPGRHARRASCDEEWSVAPERVRCEALVRLPHRLVMFVGQAWLPEGAEVRPTTSTTRTRGGRPTSTTGPTRPTSRCAAWPACCA